MKKIFFFLFLFGVSILQAQNVGIGVTSPQEKLDVNGGVKVGYSPSAFSAGTMRFNGTEMEYNTGFAWRSLVNSYSEVALSPLTPLISNVRNTWVEVPTVSLTINQPGIYLVMFKASGYNNNAYFPSGGNYDQYGFLDFRMNGGALTSPNSRRFLVADYSGDGNNTIVRFESNPTEYSTIVSVGAATTFKIYAKMQSLGTVTGDWVLNEAAITSIRLY